MPPPEKILAIKFKFLGDVVIGIPAFRALHERWPDAQLHLLVTADAAPVVEHLPWVHKVWAYPRKRGQSGIGKTWPMLRALRAERFDRSVDFVGGDRTALLSRFIGARHRLGVVAPLGFTGRRYCYNERIAEAPLELHETLRDLHVLTAWDVPLPASLASEVHADPALVDAARRQFSVAPVIAHLSTSQPKKEWPVTRWAEIGRRAAATGLDLLFSTGPSEREQDLLSALQREFPEAKRLPTAHGLPEFLALLKCARLFVSGDTGPLHFAAGLGVPTIAIFGPTDPVRWSPLGPAHRVVAGSACTCSGHTHLCWRVNPCIEDVTVDAVWNRITELHG